MAFETYSISNWRSFNHPQFNLRRRSDLWLKTEKRQLKIYQFPDISSVKELQFMEKAIEETKIMHKEGAFQEWKRKLKGRGYWCRRKDLNLHPRTRTATWTQRVCHSATSAFPICRLIYMRKTVCQVSNKKNRKFFFVNWKSKREPGKWMINTTKSEGEFQAPGNTYMFKETLWAIYSRARMS